MQARRAAFFSLVFIFLASISIFCFLDRAATQWVQLAFFCASFSYFWLVTQHSSKNLFYLGLATRLLLFLSLPTLSNDIFRFLWDGKLMTLGLDPYAALPESLVQQNLTGLSAGLYEKLNSPSYFSVYPPLNQWLFWLAAKIGNGNELIGTNVLRLILIAAEIGSYFLLKKLLLFYGKSENLANWYFLNPLIILEIAGNVHLEGLVIFFILAGIYFLSRERIMAASVGFGLAIATKFLPLLFIPALFFNQKFKKGTILSALAIFIGVLPFLGFFSITTLSGIGNSLSLYFQKFEFNASIYYLVREVGFWVKGYNIIEKAGPNLTLISAFGVLALTAIGGFKKWQLPTLLLFSLTIYLLFATTVHPWYVLPLIPLGLLSGYYFPLVWAYLIFLTYLGYEPAGYQLNLVWVALEYVVVFCVIGYELYSHAKKI